MIDLRMRNPTMSLLTETIRKKLLELELPRLVPDIPFNIYLV